jgi:hypothetical protein
MNPEGLAFTVTCQKSHSGINYDRIWKNDYIALGYFSWPKGKVLVTPAMQE